MTTTNGREGKDRFESLQELLYSDEDDGVRVVRLSDKGSRPQCVKLQVQGVPAYGIIDSGADITIMGGVLFKKVAAVQEARPEEADSSEL